MNLCVYYATEEEPKYVERSSQNDETSSTLCVT